MERLKLILYLIPIIAAVVVFITIVVLVMRDIRQQPRRADVPAPLYFVEST